MQYLTNKPLKQVGAYIIELFNEIGQGAYGDIYTAYRKGFEQEKLACKKIKLGYDNSQQMREVEIINKVRGEYIAEVKEILRTKSRLYIFMKYYQEGDLETYLQNYRFKLTEIDLLTIFYKIIHGYYHNIYKNNIIHRDIKPQNILMENLNPYITDFGVSKDIQKNIEQLRNTFAGTLFFQSPQISGVDQNCKYSYKADIYSLGVLLYYMLFNSYPGQTKSLTDLEKGEKESVKFPHIENPSQMMSEAQNLILSLITFDEAYRIEIEELINHKIFKKIKENLRGQQEIKPVQDKQQLELNLRQIKKNILKEINGGIEGGSQGELKKVEKYYQYIFELTKELQDHIIYLGNLHQILLKDFGIDEYALDTFTLLALLFQEASLFCCKQLLEKSNSRFKSVPFHPDFSKSRFKYNIEKDIIESQKEQSIFLKEIKNELNKKLENDKKKIINNKNNQKQSSSQIKEYQQKLPYLLNYNKYDTKYLFQELKKQFHQNIITHTLIQKLYLEEYSDVEDLWKFLYFFLCMFNGTFDILNYQHTTISEYIQEKEIQLDQQFKVQVIDGLSTIKFIDQNSIIQIPKIS